MINLDGLEVFIAIGAGAFVGLVLSFILTTLALFFPILWPWSLLPIVIGTIVGFVWGINLK